VVDERAEDLRSFGLSQEMIDEIAPTEDAASVFEVWDENWSAVEMFLRCQTQWRTTMNGVLGLDYGALKWLFSLYPVEDPHLLLEDLRVMEATVVATVNKTERLTWR
jgi:hypothetical protein